jgi:hypothetical protein
VGVRLHADGHPYHHPRLDLAVARDRGQALDLLERVEHDPPDASVDRPGQLRDGLVVAVQPDPLGRHAGGERHGQLPAGTHVEGHALLGEHPDDRLAQKRLAGVEDVGVAERLDEVPAAGAEVRLVQQVHGGTEAGGELGHRQAADGEHPGGVPARGARPQRRQQRVDVLGGAQPGGAAVTDLGVQRAGLVRAHYMRSGAETPSRPSPPAMTVRAASLSHSRARISSFSGSSPTGVIRQAS